MRVSALFVYPVKALRGCLVMTAEVDALGFVDDRRFMVVDAKGRFLSQRTIPRMALIDAGLAGERLTLSAEGAGAVHVGRAADPTAPLRQVAVWKSEGLLAEDCGDAAATWLGDFLGVKCRLVRVGDDFMRPILKARARPADRVSCADAFPFLIIGEASLADLNDRLVARGEEAVPLDRFRPNVVVSGCAAFAEDTWSRFRMGEMTFRAGGPCARCIVTTTDQLTGERGLEPLRTLALYRRDAVDPTNVNFGQNLIHETKSGTLRVGEAVTWPVD